MSLIFRAAVSIFAAVVAVAAAHATERERALAVDGSARIYTLITPDKITAPLPLLIVYHGGGQTAERARRYTRFDEWAGREGYAAVYPQGKNNNWNDGRTSGDLGARDADDIEFTRAIIEQLVADGVADRGRVFLTGASNGGMMAMRAACEMGTAIAGIAPVVANLPVDWECRAKAMPALFIHGTDDEFMPYEGGEVAKGKSRRNLGTVRSVDDTIAAFEHMNGCAGVKETKTLDEVGRDKTAAVITDYDCKGAPLRRIEIQGGGHTWPGARTNIVADWLLGNTSEEVNATAEIWNFFRALPGR
ncbi:MAG: alpha/beta hydrolase family esterase [Micropepsaceae bacterium]